MSSSGDAGGSLDVVDVEDVVSVDVLVVEVVVVVDVEEAAVVVTVVGSVTLGVLGEESEPSAHATVPRARSRSAVVLITRRPTARSTPHIGLSSA
jgi:hypothetical protein